MRTVRFDVRVSNPAPLFTGCLAAVLLCVTSLAAANPDAEPGVAEESLRSYYIEVKFIQVKGEPDWAFWTQPYERAHAFPDGAGRVFGPVDVTGRMESSGGDIRQLGFHVAPENDGVVLSSPRVTQILDRRQHVARGDVPALEMQDSKVEFFNAVYNALAAKPRNFSKQDFEGTAWIVDADDRKGEPLDYASGSEAADGVLYIVEAKSTDTAGIYNLDQSVVLNTHAFKTGRTPYVRGPQILRGQFECSYDLADKSQTAFLIPMVDDEYVLVWSDFRVFTAEESRARAHQTELDAAIEKGPVVWTRPERAAKETTYVADITLMRVKNASVGWQTEAYFDGTNPDERLRSYRPKEAPRAVTTGAIQIGDTLVRLGETNTPIPDALLHESPAVSVLRVPPVPLPENYAQTTMHFAGKHPFPWIEAPPTSPNPKIAQASMTRIAHSLQSSIVERKDQLEVHWATDATFIDHYEAVSDAIKPILTTSREYTHFETRLGNRVAILTALGDNKDEVLVTFLTFSRNSASAEVR